MKSKIKIRTDVLQKWQEVNPVLLNGEIAYVSDTKSWRIGNGAWRFSELQNFPLAPASPVLGVNGKTGEVQLTAADINVFETQAQGTGDEWTPSDANEVAGRANAAFQSVNFVGEDVSNHISNSDNPHGVTAAQIGAEPTITTLPVSKGGTGSTTAGTALTALGAVASVPTDASYVKTIRAMSATDYNALGSIDPNTIYFII